MAPFEHGDNGERPEKIWIGDSWDGYSHGHWLGDRTEDRVAMSLWVQGNTDLQKHQDRPGMASEIEPPGKMGEPLRLGAYLSRFRPHQPGSHMDLAGWEGQAAAPSSVGPMGADTSICRVPSLVLNHSALLIGDD